jgi:hypothetical protein
MWTFDIIFKIALKGLGKMSSQQIMLEPLSMEVRKGNLTPALYHKSFPGSVVELTMKSKILNY